MAFPLPEEKSATVPSIEGSRLEMIQAINASAPGANFRLFTLLPRVLAFSASHSDATMNRTLESYRDNRDEFFVLLNAIPAPLRNALVLGTVAHDCYNDKQMYDASYPGVYAAGVAIKGRNGAFLCVDEIDEVCSSMSRYCQAWQTWTEVKNDLSNLRLPQRQLMDHAAAVDKQYRGTSDDGRPQFVGNETIHDKATTFIKILKRQADSARALDVTGKLPQHQSPIYVGCSAKPVESRIVQHKPKNGLKSTNALLALMLSCIKHTFPHLEPETVAVPMMPTWKQKQLSLGEQLATTLASSMFYQGGFNIIQAGGHTGHDDADAQAYVFNDTTILSKNGSATLEEHAMYKRALEYLVSLRPLIDGTRRQELTKLQEAVQTLADNLREYEAALEEKRKWCEEAKEHEARLIAEEAALRRVTRLVRAHKEKVKSAVPRGPDALSPSS